ncbi:MAG: UDP-N-acetylmuramoyl-tripeptide--D-alanyl-D-alanine ligase [Alphaproteobacteria bacterium]|nr:UDP-N-acetylmuramoyl-tripeptide--D-alanyl-D-alanine ligase [Alphaproteobacteria bacterium]
MKALWTAEDAAEATDGVTGGNWQARGVSIDTRVTEPGELFVALAGERMDGHRFVKDAFGAQAAAALVSQIPPGAPRDRLLLVSDTLRALEDMGRFNRARAQARIAAVTGSVGKTSAKEMLKLALSAHGSAFAGHGNFNNHIGTPLNLANLPPEAAFGVFELGMNHAGEIAALSRQVRPHVALITTVEAVHLEFFASEDDIADAKCEIFQGMEPGGIAVLNRDNQHFPRCRMRATAAGAEILSFGFHAHADCRVLSWQATRQGSQIRAAIGGQEVSYALNALGEQWALLSAGVLGVVQALGLDIRKSAAALGAFRELPGRGRLIPIPLKGGEALLVDDSYNASPAAMRAAFGKLAALRASGAAAGRVIAALGDMRELGVRAPELHAQLSAPLQEAGVDVVFTAGPLMRHLFIALPEHMRGSHAEDADALAPLLMEALKAGDCLLIKGSHGSKMYEIAEALQKEAADAV